MLQKLEQFPPKVQQAEFRSCLPEETRTHIKWAVNIVNDERAKHKRNLASNSNTFSSKEECCIIDYLYTYYV